MVILDTVTVSSKKFSPALSGDASILSGEVALLLAAD
jgi:hypothetical protein